MNVLIRKPGDAVMHNVTAESPAAALRAFFKSECADFKTVPADRGFDRHCITVDTDLDMATAYGDTSEVLGNAYANDLNKHRIVGKLRFVGNWSHEI